ncbi:S8 family serine peptidase [Marinobacter zhejiangensis]|uniref:Serine protease n=1 Tax=Marinobacter zhejiangensis TaxID=488535 RepID=A0A1I4QGM4_9GAMM|nr:S8 family serine peptidase [Marinobacter zhejiangensis]SFM39167.1 serine protease [Marinobacter zhejiangensis]
MGVRSRGCVYLLAAATITGLVGCGGGSSSASRDMLSGSITIESRTRVDSDTADDSRLGVAVANNTSSTAQGLPESAVVGGFLSAEAGSYPREGGTAPVFQYVTDEQDVFMVPLSDGDRITLQAFASGNGEPDVGMVIAEPGGSNVCFLDCLGNPPFTHVMSIADADPVPHLITVTADGGGPFRYVLTITSQNAASASHVGFDEPELVPDQAVIVMATADHADEQKIRGLSASLSGAELRNLGNGVWRASRVPAAVARTFSGEDQSAAKWETVRWVQSLRRLPGVVSAEPDWVYHSEAVNPDNDGLYSLQWNLPLISVPVAWLATPEAGRGVGIAILDTGILSTRPLTYGDWHPDLQANISPYSGQIVDFVSGALDNDKEDEGQRDDNPADPGGDSLQGTSFHGSHVAAIAAGVDNTIGIVGVAPEAVVYPVRVLGRNGEGSLSDLVAAINWAAGNPDIDVINLSLGGLPMNSTLETAINRAYDRGKLIVAAAGNEGTDNLTFPAAYGRVVGVGAVDAGRTRASYSNVGGSVDLVAPGGDASRDANGDGSSDLVVSAWGSRNASGGYVPGYAGLHGTSMAAPHVSGVYALMKGAALQRGRSFGPGDFFALMTAGDITDEVGNRTEYGAGLINAIKAVNRAVDGTIPTVMAASPSALQFGDSQPQQVLKLTTYPDGSSVTIDGIGPLPPWLSLDPMPQVGAAPPSQILVAVDVAQLAIESSYSAEIVLTYTGTASGQELSIPVTVLRQDEQEQRNAGRHYVLLMDPRRPDGDPVAQVVVDASNGRYDFAFSDVEPGNYLLVAGSDLDNNGSICETGEACAEYPVIGLPEPISIDDTPVAGISMTTSFRRPTLSEMGQPRYGFRGYRVNQGESVGNHAMRTYVGDSQ